MTNGVHSATGLHVLQVAEYIRAYKLARSIRAKSNTPQQAAGCALGLALKPPCEPSDPWDVDLGGMSMQPVSDLFSLS
ncbi:MAG: hypothetical protein QHG98_08250 [Methanothrix sp.]|jgi:hypothetical protein|nr:hypothetical protein [Methanothrix sp.]